MDGGRKQKWVNHRDFSENYKKGPRGSWKRNAWEKEFCTVVGNMDWGTFSYKKSFRHLIPNVLSWDDSAGKEAFDNAWRRFWYKKKGYVCDTPLPDPDLYIDIIDWEAEVDPELLRDLENVPVVNYTNEEDKEKDRDKDQDHGYTGVNYGWNSPVGPSWGNVGPSYVPPYVGPTFVWQYPAPGVYWYYTNNYVGLPVMWSYNNVATRPFEPSYRTQTRRNSGGWRRPKYTKKRSGGQMQGRGMQSK